MSTNNADIAACAAIIRNIANDCVARITYRGLQGAACDQAVHDFWLGAHSALLAGGNVQAARAVSGTICFHLQHNPWRTNLRIAHELAGPANPETAKAA